MNRNMILLLILANPLFAFCQTNIGKDSKYFLGVEYFENLGLKRGETTNDLRVYNADNKQNQIERLVDIRWVLNSETEAIQFLKENLVKQSEEGVFFSFPLNNTQISEQYLYRESKQMQNMMEVFGMKGLTSWIYIFRIKNIVSKIFVFGKQVPLSMVTSIADSASNLICGNLHLPITNTRSYPFPISDSSFKEKSKNIYSKPSGFRVAALDKDLATFFDNELVYENTKKKLRLRYKLFDFEKEYYSTDSSAYINKVMSNLLTVPLNFYLPEGNDELNNLKSRVIENKESIKLANCDYIILTNGKISNKSELAKGYQYGITLCFIKKDYPILYLFFEYNNEETAMAEYLNIRTTINYPANN
ncbi:MAG: hypothetical protein WAT19_14445 [Ferruginibacter sp.]